jgi:hypothetical protein
MTKDRVAACKAYIESKIIGELKIWEKYQRLIINEKEKKDCWE